MKATKGTACEPLPGTRLWLAELQPGGSPPRDEAPGHPLLAAEARVAFRACALAAELRPVSATVAAGSHDPASTTALTHFAAPPLLEPFRKTVLLESRGQWGTNDGRSHL
jgi:hypothetical protein